MTTKTSSKITLSKEWKKLLGKDNVDLNKAASEDVNWVYEMLGWKKHARRHN